MTLASPSKAVQWSGELSGKTIFAHLSWVSWRFVLLQIFAFSTLELALVTLEWAFATVGKIVWLGSYFEYSSTRARHTCTSICHCGKVSIRIFDLRRVDQGHRVQFSHWCHSMANVKIYKRHFIHFQFLLRFDLRSRKSQTERYTHTQTEPPKPRL